MNRVDSFNVYSEFLVDNKKYNFFSLRKLEEKLQLKIKKLPYSLKVLVENLLRNEDSEKVKPKDISTLVNCVNSYKTDHEIRFTPSRVLMQDMTGVPAIVDLACMRDYLSRYGLDSRIVNPKIPVDLVIDHSVQVDYYGNNDAFLKNVALEIERNRERYEFLKWGQLSFSNFRVVPPGMGICHQVNLEYFAKVVWTSENLVYPDTLVGTDSHTTMVNGLAVLGWGVGGIEAEAAILGQPISMLIPEVIGVKLTGKLKKGVTATDLVLTITNILRARGVVNKFVEFYGDGLKYLSVADRATVANMAPEYGATCGFFPIDVKTLEFLELTGRDRKLINLVEVYAKEQYLWYDGIEDINYFDKLELNLSDIESSVAGPKRPQDKVSLSKISESFKEFSSALGVSDFRYEGCSDIHKLKNGDVVIAAITSCTNTSNPSVMIAAGLVARNALRLGLKIKPWVKSSLAPGSKVVTEYLNESGLQKYLDELGFNLVGYGCTTCIGNSGPLSSEIEKEIKDRNLVVASVLSGNRNFEGRINQFVKANYLASPPLVVIYALVGTVNIDLTQDPIFVTADGRKIYMKDVWPSDEEIKLFINNFIKRDMFVEKYQNIFFGDDNWQNMYVEDSDNYNWNSESTYIQNPPYFESLNIQSKKDNKIYISNANILALLGDSITTDHISPAGNISYNSPASKFLISKGIAKQDFNSYGSRRGNHNVMMRGTLANIRIRNEMVNGVEGGITKYIPTNEVMSIFDAAMMYKNDAKPLVIIAGKEYGSGSSRDWAAKGVLLLGVKAIIAESFERIHRSNLVGMGILPLTFKDSHTRKTLKLTGNETITLFGEISLLGDVECTITRESGVKEKILLRCNLNTKTEMDYFLAGGVLHFVLCNMLKTVVKS